MKGVEQPAEFHPEGDVFVHTLLLLENLPHPCPMTLAWGALLQRIRTEQIKAGEVDLRFGRELVVR